MGTNYYHRTEECPTCGRSDEEHIGKSSAGWTFTFHGTEQIRSWEDWRRVLRSGGRILDEYGRVVTVEEFEALVESKRDEPRNHAREFADRYDDWLDDEGNSFSSGEFS